MFLLTFQMLNVVVAFMSEAWSTTLAEVSTDEAQLLVVSNKGLFLLFGISGCQMHALGWLCVVCFQYHRRHLGE